MPVKIIWDYTFYWALLAPMFFAGRIADIGMFGRLREQFERGSALNTAMQALLREWGERNAGRALPLDSRVLDQYRIDWFHELNRALADQLNDDAFAARITSNVERMGWLGAEILQRARAEHAEIGDHGLDALAVGDASPLPSLSASWYASAA